MIIDSADFTGYTITGLLYNSTRRFVKRTTNLQHAFGINLWRGSVWGTRKTDGKRQLLKRCFN
jgi:hypothetical protein